MADELVPVFRVADVHSSAPWYARVGFEVIGQHQFEPGFPLYVFLRRGDVQLHLSEHTGDAPFHSLAYFYVDDVDALAKEFDMSPEEQPWGREIELVDPDGNRIRVGTVNDPPS